MLQDEDHYERQFGSTKSGVDVVQGQQPDPHQFLEEVSDSLVVAPLLNTGQKSIVELPVDLVELRHFEEDGFYLGNGEHRL